ncbi:MAG TPA: iron dependent repressor, metal binding and dimerization domain protein [Gaiellaceae bacterium]|nr:iron dependent repressor, metal binding and dimerization domain protein [Gaiellaceae bacterium]
MAASADPLILTCGGASSEARDAELVADTLAAAGLGIRAGSPVAEAALIAVDGCAGACCSRRLDAAGLRPVAVVDAAAARTPPGAVAIARLQLEQRRPRRHRARPAPPSATPATRSAHSVRDYLLALDELTAPVVDCGTLAPGLPTLASHISRLLGISRASGGEMLDRLDAMNLVTRTDGRQVALTEAGRAAADIAVRRHRILETFAVRTLGYTVADSFETARTLDVAFDDDAIERLALSLGAPTRCPHGWPIEPREAREAARTLRTLATVEAGEPATVVALAERQVEALRELAAAGVEPETEIVEIVRRTLSAAARRAAFV